MSFSFVCLLAHRVRVPVFEVLCSQRNSSAPEYARFRDEFDTVRRKLIESLLNGRFVLPSFANLFKLMREYQWHV